MASAPSGARAGPPLQRERAIRLLIVDDSAVVRAVFSRMLQPHEQFHIAAMLPDAAGALDFLVDHRVDVILLDIEMPGMDGLTALPRLIAASHGARVLVVSSAAEAGAVATLKALALGAADTLAKPGAEAFRGRFADTLAERLLRLGRADSVVAPTGAEPNPVESWGSGPALRPSSVEPVCCLAVGASTGGIHALADLFRTMPATFDAPILITQHLPANFMGFFASQVAAMAGRPTEVAQDGMRLRNGAILIAPGDAHLGLAGRGDRVIVSLGHQPSVSGCMPSVDPMLESVAEAYGAGGLAIILSGMGRDGQDGATRLAAAGGTILAQDQASSVVWGMPGAVARAGLCSAILPPALLGARVQRRGRA